MWVSCAGGVISLSQPSGAGGARTSTSRERNNRKASGNECTQEKRKVGARVDEVEMLTSAQLYDWCGGR